MSIQTIGQLEAGRRQLDTAIWLWFNGEDEVSIHTLVSAAHGIINDLNRQAKGPPLLFDSPTIKMEFRKKAVALMKSFENFFKHADGRKQKAKILDFDPDISLGYIYVCLAGLSYLKQPPNHVEIAMQTWLFLHRPAWIKESVRIALADGVSIEKLDAMRNIQREDFLKVLLEALRQRNES